MPAAGRGVASLLGMLHHVESGSGRPVVLLHAFPMDSSLWATQRQSLAQGGHRVITPDLPGFGGSALAAEPPSLDVMADAVVGLLDELGIERAVVGGLSMGGYVTMALLRRHPAASCRRSSWPTPRRVPTPRMRPRIVRRSPPPSRPRGLRPASPTGCWPTSWAPPRGSPGPMWSRPCADGSEPSLRPEWRGHSGRWRHDPIPWRTSRPSAVRCWSCTAPRTPISPASDARAMADAARSGGSATTVVEIPAAGHLTAVEDPDAVSHALGGWLATL